MVFAPSSRQSTPRITGITAVLTYLAGTAAWMTVVFVLSAVAMALDAAVRGAPGPVDPALVPTWIIAASGLVQMGGMLGLALVLAPILGSRRHVLALRAPRSIAPWIAAALGGATVGLFPGWIAESMRRWVPGLDFGGLSTIGDAITEGPLASRLVFLFVVCVGAPITEELVFRGFLFKGLSRVMPRWATWLATSAMFALYHIDPIHVTAVLFTGLFLGWLRLVSGSVWPGLVAHTVNNLYAAVATILATEATTTEPLPVWAAALGGLLTVGLGALAWTARSNGIPEDVG